MSTCNTSKIDVQTPRTGPTGLSVGENGKLYSISDISSQIPGS